MARHSMNLVLAASLAVGLAGCGSEVEQSEVRGKVTLGGQPFHECMIVFRDAEKGIHMTTRVADDGAYRIATAKGFGLPPGTYQVAVSPAPADVPIGVPPSAIPPSPIPVKYQRVETSGLTLTLGPQGAELDIEMEP